MLYRYDDDVLLEEVDADFVVWEVHGRHDYTYTATAKKVKKSILSTHTVDRMIVVAGWMSANTTDME